MKLKKTHLTSLTVLLNVSFSEIFLEVSFRLGDLIVEELLFKYVPPLCLTLAYIGSYGYHKERLLFYYLNFLFAKLVPVSSSMNMTGI